MVIIRGVFPLSFIEQVPFSLSVPPLPLFSSPSFSPTTPSPYPLPSSFPSLFHLPPVSFPSFFSKFSKEVWGVLWAPKPGLRRAQAEIEFGAFKMKNLTSGENISVKFMKNYIDLPLSLAKHTPLKFFWSICSIVYTVQTPLWITQWDVSSGGDSGTALWSTYDS